MNVKPLDREKQAELGRLLKAVYDSIASEEAPGRLTELVKKLGTE